MVIKTNPFYYFITILKLYYWESLQNLWFILCALGSWSASCFSALQLFHLNQAKCLKCVQNAVLYLCLPLSNKHFYYAKGSLAVSIASSLSFGLSSCSALIRNLCSSIAVWESVGTHRRRAERPRPKGPWRVGPLIYYSCCRWQCATVAIIAPSSQSAT